MGWGINNSQYSENPAATKSFKCINPTFLAARFVMYEKIQAKYLILSDYKIENKNRDLRGVHFAGGTVSFVFEGCSLLNNSAM